MPLASFPKATFSSAPGALPTTTPSPTHLNAPTGQENGYESHAKPSTLSAGETWLEVRHSSEWVLGGLLEGEKDTRNRYAAVAAAAGGGGGG
jgi:hypothetical protein